MSVTSNSAPRLAEGVVGFVERKFGFKLPYTPASLILVDAIVDKIKATGADERQARGLLTGLGCYTGEVLVRHARASWRARTEMKTSEPCRVATVLALPGPIACDPIGCVFERFSGGATASAAGLFESAVRRDSASGRFDG